MTKEFIKRVDLENRLHALCAAQRITAQDAIDIAILPAADVAPVVRGRWVHGDYGPYCSNCDGYPPTRKRYGHPGDTEFDYTKFCPSCGADMREVQDDD